MTPARGLNPEAVATLEAAGLTPDQWMREHYYTGGWGGDECGCPDDRCIGYHHDAEEECGCLPALLDELSP